MLTPEQVIPFLQHDDAEVRQHAVLYLAGAHDPAPATADDFWRAIDKVGPENAGQFTERLELLPQTDESVRRTLEALGGLPADARHGLLRVLRSLDIDRARKHRDAIASSEHVPPDVTEHLDQRLALAEEPVEPLWDRLMAQAAALEGKQLTEEDALAAERVIEALARRPDVAADRAVALLRDPAVRDWREVIVADLVGEMRLKTPEAIDALIDKLKDQEADILWETAGEALVRVGSRDVVNRLAERFPGEDWGFKISAAGVLGRIKLPEAEAAIVRLIPGETDKEVVTFLAASLLDLVPTDPEILRSVRQLILDERYEPGTADLRSMLIAAGQMVGYAPEEAEQWKAQREADRQRWESGAADADGILAAITQRRIGAEDLGPVGQILGIPDSRPLQLPPLRPATRNRRPTPGRRGASSYAPAQHAPPIRRQAAKVGRHDPSPCYSGNKYKNN
jgi:HEAT repeat protein